MPQEKFKTMPMTMFGVKGCIKGFGQVENK